MRIHKSTGISFFKKLRSNRKASFMFIPKSLPYPRLIFLILLELFQSSKSDSMLITFVIRDLQKRKVLGKDPIKYSYFELGSSVYHDVYITASNGDTFFRGTSVNLFEAYAKAFGEFFERIFLQYNLDQETIICSQKDMQYNKQAFVSYLDFPQPTQKQKKFFHDAIITETDMFSWTQATLLSEGIQKWIPSQCIFFRNKETFKNEKTIIQQSTHGAAGGYTQIDAIRSGIHEIIHRHFFLAFWYLKKSPFKIKLESIPHDSIPMNSIKNFEQQGFTVSLLDFSAEASIPTIICILERCGGYSCGGSTASTMDECIQRALTEAFSTYLWTQKITVSGTNRLTQEAIDSIKDGFIDTVMGDDAHRILAYANSAYTTEMLRYMLSGEESEYTAKYDKKSSYDIVAHAQELFGGVYAYTYKDPLLTEYEYSVVRIVIPGSYFFALNEIHSRPILYGVEPVYTGIHPFP